MRKFIAIIATAGLGLTLVSAAVAHPWWGHKRASNGVAKLTGSQEVPPVSTDAKGIALFKVRHSDGSTSIRYHVGVRRIDNVTASHIHCAKRGENGPVVADLYPATGAEARTPGKGWAVRGAVTAVKPGVTCKLRNGSDLAVATVQDLVKLMRQGMTYTNVHTTDHPSGEVRGQIRMHRAGWWRR